MSLFQFCSTIIFSLENKSRMKFEKMERPMFIFLNFHFKCSRHLNGSGGVEALSKFDLFKSLPRFVVEFHNLHNSCVAPRGNGNKLETNFSSTELWQSFNAGEHSEFATLKVSLSLSNSLCFA